MKKFILLAFGFFSIVANAQKFDFDLITKYKVSVEDHITEHVVYSNKKDPNYFLQVSLQNAKLEGKLINLKTFEIHRYEVADSKMGDSLELSFKYLTSEKIPHNKEYYSYHFQIDSLNHQQRITVLKGKNRKKTDMNVLLKLEKSDYNQFPLYRFSCFHPFEIRKDLDIQGNYRVKSSEGYNFQGFKFICELVDYVDIKLELEVGKP